MKFENDNYNKTYIKNNHHKGGKKMEYENDDNWVLYKRDVKLRDRETLTVYFFSRRVPKVGTPCDVPADKRVVINRRTGFPFLVGK